MKSQSLSGKIAIVTGGGRGIGAATARLLADRGARVAVMSRTSSEVSAVVAEIQKLHGAERALALSAELGDVSSEAAVKAAFEKVNATWGAVTILVNCAGVLAHSPFAELPLEQWEQVFAVNVRGSFLCSREFFRQRRKNGETGAIANVSSLGGIRGTVKFAGYAAYTASKHAVVGLTEAAAVEGKPLGIRVNCVAPGAVDTLMLRSADPSLKTNTRPEDIAQIIAYLCDDTASHALTGAIIEANTNA